MTRGSTTARGYGTQHQRERRRVARLVNAGLAYCWRCRKHIEPGSPWDLGHDDRDRSITRGPEHQHCNRATKAHQPPRARPASPHPGIVR